MNWTGYVALQERKTGRWAVLYYGHKIQEMETKREAVEYCDRKEKADKITNDIVRRLHKRFSIKQWSATGEERVRYSVDYRDTGDCHTQMGTFSSYDKANSYINECVSGLRPEFEEEAKLDAESMYKLSDK